MHLFPPAPRRFHLALAATALLASAAAPSAAADDAARVVSSIRPVHSLVSAVMAGVGEPHLVMRKGASHHSFDMRPSDAAVLQEAGIVYLVDEAMESGLARAIDTLASDARVIELSAAQGLVRRPLRSGGTFEEDPFHEHDDHGDDDHGHRHTHKPRTRPWSRSRPRSMITRTSMGMRTRMAITTTTTTTATVRSTCMSGSTP